MRSKIQKKLCDTLRKVNERAREKKSHEKGIDKFSLLVFRITHTQSCVCMHCFNNVRIFVLQSLSPIIYECHKRAHTYTAALYNIESINYYDQWGNVTRIYESALTACIESWRK